MNAGVPSTLPVAVSDPLPDRTVLIAAGTSGAGTPSHSVAQLLVRALAAGQHLGQAPVHHQDLAELPDHHVGRLQVAVDHTAGVGVSDCVADLVEDLQELQPIRRRFRALGEQVGESIALDQLHGEVGSTIGETAEVVDGHDAGVLELTADLSFLDERAVRPLVCPRARP